MNAMSLAEVLQKIKEASLRAQRSDVPALMAVSKVQPFEKMLELYDQGQRVFGENYVQELVDKKKQFDAANLLDADLQFIGHLQTNKVKSLLPFVSTLHSVDSFKLLDEVEKRAQELNKKIGCYFQVNIDDEESKGGFLVSDLSQLQQKMSELRFVIPLGLMCIPDPEKNVSAAFNKLRTYGLKMPQCGAGLSMGMSSDYEDAIASGSTVVRIGSALFGPRKNAAPK